MALSGKYISCLRAIDRVYQDANLEVNFTEAIEWVGDVMDLIGCPVLYKTIVTNGMEDEDFPGVYHSPIEVVNYRGELPAGIIKILGVLNYETQAALHENTDTFYKSYGNSDHPNQIYENCYTVNNNHIFTGFEEGKLEIAYSAYKTDENGFPLVPDETKITRAITSYITERLDYRNLRKGIITQQLYRDSQQKRDFDLASADMKVHLPSIDRMETWSKMNLNLLPRLTLHKHGFRHNPVRRNGYDNTVSVGNPTAPVTLDIDFQTLTYQKLAYANPFRITRVDGLNSVNIQFSDGVLPVWNLNELVIAYRELTITPLQLGVITLHIEFV